MKKGNEDERDGYDDDDDDGDHDDEYDVVGWFSEMSSWDHIERLIWSEWMKPMALKNKKHARKTSRELPWTNLRECWHIDPVSSHVVSLYHSFIILP